MRRKLRTFRFNSLKPPARPQEFHGGKLLLPRQMAARTGGFDENFTVIAYRFEGLSLPIRWRPVSINQLHYSRP